MSFASYNYNVYIFKGGGGGGVVRSDYFMCVTFSYWSPEPTLSNEQNRLLETSQCYTDFSLYLLVKYQYF